MIMDECRVTIFISYIHLGQPLKIFMVIFSVYLDKWKYNTLFEKVLFIIVIYFKDIIQLL